MISARLVEPQYATLWFSDPHVEEMRLKILPLHLACLRTWLGVLEHVAVCHQGCYELGCYATRGATHVFGCEIGERLLRRFLRAEKLMQVEQALIEAENGIG